MIGDMVAGAARAGDLFSSFVKRRLNLPSSGQRSGSIRCPNPFAYTGIPRCPFIDDRIIALGIGIFFIGALPSPLRMVPKQGSSSGHCCLMSEVVAQSLAACVAEGIPR